MRPDSVSDGMESLKWARLRAAGPVHCSQPSRTSVATGGRKAGGCARYSAAQAPEVHCSWSRSCWRAAIGGGGLPAVNRAGGHFPRHRHGAVDHWVGHPCRRTARARVGLRASRTGRSHRHHEVRRLARPRLRRGPSQVTLRRTQRGAAAETGRVRAGTGPAPRDVGRQGRHVALPGPAPPTCRRGG